ncbi:hypothetical protein A8L34_28005 [Bacillus sp. FJAT-27264]|uniref:MobP3 family relaxase n=1 Tax=Paenibacillus sp. (strain DSM 101736 / FJAT-27264) TaxID=1850362 RepID=UPI0008080318|nr:MobP3 family relaxase [Bacillus sp. FJAT-27264]OBZ15893.1 hypothetical protein A8L34_28005 [Bacillus sp. FJAT-27264]
MPDPKRGGGGGRRHDAPFVMKVRFYDPSRDPEAREKNAAHVMYIGFRQGVDKGSLSPEQEVTYDPESPAGHLGYIHQRPRSHGLFVDDEDHPNPADIQKELLAHKGIVWRMVLSLKETDAVRLGMTDRSAWETALRASINEAGEKMGIGVSNLKWAAAFHNEPGHPHVHLIMWEKNPKRKIGKMSDFERKAVKKAFMKEIYAKERLQLNTEKTMMRELMREMTTGTVLDKVDLIRDIRREQEGIDLMLLASGAMPVEYNIPQIHDFQADRFAMDLELLRGMLPQRGRMAYQYMSPAVKDKLDEMAGWVISQPQFNETRERYFKAVEDMTRQYSFKPEDIEASHKKAEADLKKRLAQIILRGAVESGKDRTFQIDPDKAAIVVSKFSEAIKPVIDPVPTKVMTEQIKILRGFRFNAEEQKRVFESWKNHASLGLDKSEIEALVDHLNDLDEDIESPRNSDRSGKEESDLIHILKFSGATDKEIKQILLDKVIAVEPTDLDNALKAANKEILKADQTLVTERDFKKMMEGVGLDPGEYPWTMKETQEVNAETSKEVIEAFAESSCSNHEDRSWTGFTMAVALRHLGFSTDRMRDFLEKWVRRNGYENEVNIKSILTTLSENESKEKENSDPKYLRKPTWGRLMDNLGLSFDYPWSRQEELIIDPQLFKEAKEKLLGSDKATEDSSLRKWLADMFVRFMRNDPEEKHVVPKLIDEWQGRHGVLSEGIREELILKSEQRTQDVEAFAKFYGIKDEVYQFIRDMALVLYSAGLKTEEVLKLILDWKERSGTQISLEKIDRAVTAAEKHVKDLRDWRREPVISKKRFAEVCRMLGLKDVPWMWRHEKESMKMNQSFASKFLRSLGKNIIREMRKNEAKNELEKRKMLKRIEHQMEREEQQNEKGSRGR